MNSKVEGRFKIQSLTSLVGKPLEGLQVRKLYKIYMIGGDANQVIDILDSEDVAVTKRDQLQQIERESTGQPNRRFRIEDIFVLTDGICAFQLSSEFMINITSSHDEDTTHSVQFRAITS